MKKAKKQINKVVVEKTATEKTTPEISQAEAILYKNTVEDISKLHEELKTEEKNAEKKIREDLKKMTETTTPKDKYVYEEILSVNGSYYKVTNTETGDVFYWKDKPKARARTEKAHITLIFTDTEMSEIQKLAIGNLKIPTEQLINQNMLKENFFNALIEKALSTKDFFKRENSYYQERKNATPKVSEKLQEIKRLQEAYKKANDGKEITSDKILKALVVMLENNTISVKEYNYIVKNTISDYEKHLKQEKTISLSDLF
jgi:hypothetical protein